MGADQVASEVTPETWWELAPVDQRSVTEMLKADADVDTGLELTIPLIPLVLDYQVNLDLSSGPDPRQWWENLQERLRRS